jgi:hypothetical protein
MTVTIGPDTAHGDTSSDLCQVYDSNFVVTGFFTPDYAPLASAFAKNLTEHRVSHHLYARAKIAGGWGSQTLQKPSALAAARRDYPGKILILMDVDCRVRGDIAEIVQTQGDFALRLKRKATKFGHALMPCARVVVVRPTAGGAAFVDDWEAECRSCLRTGDVDETALLTSMENSGGIYSVAALPLRYVGDELRDAAADAVIVHNSTHDTTRPASALRKSIQKHFRIGRNAAFRLATGQSYDERRGR